mmetsp:Transcript_17594/g.36757  ORF Transcript_17594/g.36757 Transcript_17594/m.36757 type:complete len:187 (-) Transcript_17594:53-613(-)
MANMASMAGRTGPTGSPQNYAANAGNTFRQVATELANELVAQLTQEHTREVTAMYQEVLVLRSELQRVAELMQGYMQRERQLHEMMDQLTNTYQEATSHFHAAHSQFNDHAKTTTMSHQQQRQALVDPMRDTEMELQRINALLAQQPIPPENSMGFPAMPRSQRPVQPVASRSGLQSPFSSRQLNV